MQNIKEETYKTIVLVSTTCDVCSRSCKEDNWSTEHYGVDKIKIEREEGTSYPGDYDVARITFDLCPDCWQNLTEYLKSLGASPTVKEPY